MRNFRYKDDSGKWKFIDEADAEYGGANEAKCEDTNWRRLSDNPGWMRNIREQTRGKYGGLKLPPGDDYGEVGAWDWWPSLSDVARRSTHFTYIGTLHEDGVVNGCESNKFCPNNILTRGQMAKVIVKGLGEATGAYQGYLVDVPITHVFRPYIEAIKELGITKGCNPPANDRYCPGKSVTRAQLDTFLARALDIQGDPAKADHFSDDGNSVHHNNINLLRDRRIVTGCGDGEFCPNTGVKRKDMARWVVRAFNLWQGAP